MKKVVSVFLLVAVIASLCSCSVVKDKLDGGSDLQAFYDKVSESQQLLDDVADTIYSNWYDAIYEDEFGEDINTAILAAQLTHADDLERIEALDAEIAEAFKNAKDSNKGELVKDIMSAYSDYYEFVVNVSGSFNTFSADKETLKKELASLLRELSYEL